MSDNFDFASAARPEITPAAGRWSGFAPFNFVGGHNAPEAIPVADLVAAATRVLEREGTTLATYRLESGPQGYLALREFIAQKVKRDAEITCNADDVLLTSGSLQGLDLINEVLLKAGDVVIIEEATYGGVISKFTRLDVTVIGIPLDEDGMRMDVLSQTLDDLKAKGTTPKFIFTIPTIQNPTATIMSLERRHQLLDLAKAHDVPIVEDDCYADLIWDGKRPAAIHALDDSGRVIYVGSFSKSLAPALRVGYLIAPWGFLSAALGCKTDAGSGALEQMVLAEYCASHFEAHVTNLNSILKSKCDVLVEALGENFGTAAEFVTPKGGIFIWVKLPASVDTTKLAQVADQEGITINPGAEWSIAGEEAKRWIRICYANPSKDVIRKGVAALAEVCNREFGVPSHIANIERS